MSATKKKEVKKSKPAPVKERSPKGDQATKESSPAPGSGLTVERSFEIKLKILLKIRELALKKWEAIAPTIKDSDKRAAFRKLENELEKSSEIKAEYRALGTSGEEFERFQDTITNSDVDAYLESHPEFVKKVGELDEKSSQFLDSLAPP